MVYTRIGVDVCLSVKRMRSIRVDLVFTLRGITVYIVQGCDDDVLCCSNALLSKYFEWHHRAVIASSTRRGTARYSEVRQIYTSKH